MPMYFWGNMYDKLWKCPWKLRKYADVINLFSAFPAEFKECFSLYDKKQKGKIVAKDLITVMRCLGTSPTFGEIERHLQVHKIGKVQHTVILICL